MRHRLPMGTTVYIVFVSVLQLELLSVAVSFSIFLPKLALTKKLWGWPRAWWVRLLRSRLLKPLAHCVCVSVSQFLFLFDWFCFSLDQSKL